METINGLETKQCAACKEVKPVEEFYTSKHSRDGFTSYCKLCKRLRNQQGVKKIKLEVFSHYTNNDIKCHICGFNDIRALSLDHINGNGNQHRIEICTKLNYKNPHLGGLGKNMYYYLKKENYPPGFQVICMNCQFIKRHENQEWTSKNND